jgi:sulfite dehydrogenase (quinone) subunit SoeB
MKKCTLCVDRIYDQALPEAERQPACVLACPTHARFFGDFDDPASSVSQMTADRGGFGLLEELGYRPVNRYLPPREPPRVDVEADGEHQIAGDSLSALGRLIDAARRFAAR